MFLLLWSHDIHIFQSAPLFSQYQTDVPGTCGWTWKRFVSRVLISSPERSQNMKATRKRIEKRGAKERLWLSCDLKRKSCPAKQVSFLGIYQGNTNHQGSKGHKSRLPASDLFLFGVYRPQPQQCAWYIRRPFFKSNAQNCQNKEGKEN